MRAGLAIAAAVLAAGCGGPAQPSVDRAWVRLPAVSGRPAAAYFTLHGGRADATLIGVEAAGTAKAEMHESMAMGPMTTMRPLASVALPAGATVAFAPSGNHVMLFGVDPRLTPGRTLPLTLHFADRDLRTTAHVVGAADPAP